MQILLDHVADQIEIHLPDRDGKISIFRDYHPGVQFVVGTLADPHLIWCQADREGSLRLITINGMSKIIEHVGNILRPSHLVDQVGSLFDAIAHGDEDHRAWLKKAIAAHFADEPIPPRFEDQTSTRIKPRGETP